MVVYLLRGVLVRHRLRHDDGRSLSLCQLEKIGTKKFFANFSRHYVACLPLTIPYYVCTINHTYVEVLYHTTTYVERKPQTKTTTHNQGHLSSKSKTTTMTPSRSSNPLFILLLTIFTIAQTSAAAAAERRAIIESCSG